jgi:predicted MFS family arabinose efflux permease
MDKRIGTAFVAAKILESVGMAWWFSTNVLFLQGLGLDLFQANLLNMMFMGLSSVLDPFTGNWGDRIGQKRIYLFGMLAWSVSHLIYWQATGFWGCAASEIVGAVGLACRSEALESWMRNHADETVTHKALTDGAYWARLAMIPTAVLGGFVGSRWGMEWPYFLSGVTGLLALVVIWLWLRFIPERPDGYEVDENNLKLWVIAKNAWRDPVLRKTFIVSAILFACFQPFNMFWQIVFKEASGSASWLGLLWIGIALASALGSKLAFGWKINSKGLALIIVSIGLPMLLPRVNGPWMILILIPFLFHEVGRSMWLPVLWTYTNRRISSSTRTSVNSLRSSAGTAGAVAGLLISGYLTKVVSPTTVWGISAIALLCVSLWVWRWNHE